MGIAKRWAGNAYGTSAGNLYVQFKGDDEALTGTLRLNDSTFGLTVYSIQAKFDGGRLTLTGEPETEASGVVYGKLSATATLGAKGELFGDWQTDIGSAGTLILFPHTRPEGMESQEVSAPQLHTARHDFGAIEIDREQIIAIADDLQSDFSNGTVVVTFASGTQQSRFLEDFKSLKITAEKAEVIKIVAQQSEPGGINRVVSIEFGPQWNAVTIQSSSEAWALGKCEALKRDLQRFERSYATKIRWLLGFGVNQALLLWVIIYIPSLPNLWDRALFLVAILALIVAINWLHTNYLPFAAIYLTKKPI